MAERMAKSKEKLAKRYAEADAKKHNTVLLSGKKPLNATHGKVKPLAKTTTKTRPRVADGVAPSAFQNALKERRLASGDMSPDDESPTLEASLEGPSTTAAGA
eukprot:3669900-Pyramimonas_sp.AAC.1